MFKKIFICIICIPILSLAQNSHNPKALALNKQAFQLLIRGEAGSLYTTKANLKVIKLLDSAITIEPKYVSALMNKLSSLIYLKRYQDAITTVNKAALYSPDDFSIYLKGGIIYQDYLKQNSNAKKYFEKAYSVALAKEKMNNHKILRYDINIALSLCYFRGKNSALLFLDKISLKYKDKKSKDEITYYKSLLSKTTFDTENNMSFFRNYSTV